MYINKEMTMKDPVALPCPYCPKGTTTTITTITTTTAPYSPYSTHALVPHHHSQLPFLPLSPENVKHWTG